MNEPRPMMDGLESRTLLSGTSCPTGVPVTLPPLPKNAGPAATADYAALQKDVAALQADGSKLATDQKTLQAAIAALLQNPSTALTDARNTLKADQQAAATAFKTDQAAIFAVYKADGPAILTDLQNIAKDRLTGNTTQLQTDEAQLKADQTTLQNDLVAPENQLKTDQQQYTILLKADEQAIQTAIDTDPTVAPALAAVQADQAQLKTDATQFQTDLKQYLIDLKNNA
jgi:hypothetical protein